MGTLNKRKRVTQINGIKFTNEKVSERILRIRDGSDVCEYLVIGNDRAALIDTGYGIGDLKGYVDSLTDKPYDVYVTHGHVDHASGAAQFNRVYMNHADIELYKKHTDVEFREKVLAVMCNHLETNDFIPQRTEPFENITDGMLVDLGGVSLRFIHVPGHTHGMMVPICLEQRTAFFGDACGVGVLLMLEESLTAKEYLASLQKLQKFENLYDTVLRQHGKCESTPRVLEDNIENCEKILAGTDAHIPSQMMDHICYWACPINENGLRTDGKEGNIRYTEDHIR